MKMALIGSSGFAEMYYYRALRDNIPEGLDQLCGIIDPFVEQSPFLDEYRRRHIPLYHSLTEFYAQDTCDLLFIASPTRFHKEQILEAFAHGTTVLCEKPLTATLQEAEELQQLIAGREERLGVGFQWSFTKGMRRIKQDSLSGLLGKPVYLKSHISWPRPDSYYTESTWHGHLKAENGRWILDSISANAVAHYLHNIFFVLGDSEDHALMPDYIEGSIYRGKPFIESFDSCFYHGGFANGAEFFFTATHAAEKKTNPRFEYRFTNGTVFFDQDQSDECYAILKNGNRISYGKPQVKEPEGLEKIRCMMDVAKGLRKPPCMLHTILPHLKVSNAVLDHMPIQDFPDNMRIVQNDPAAVWIDNLWEMTEQCYQREKLPDEIGFSWASPSTYIDLKDYHTFNGQLLG